MTLQDGKAVVLLVECEEVAATHAFVMAVALYVAMESAAPDMSGQVMELVLMKTKMVLMEPLHTQSLVEGMNQQGMMVPLAPAVRYSPVVFPVPAAQKQ